MIDQVMDFVYGRNRTMALNDCSNISDRSRLSHSSRFTLCSIEWTEKNLPHRFFS